MLLALLPGIVIMVLMLAYAFRRYQSMQPQVTLQGLPQDVENGLTDETPEARGFWKMFHSEFLPDFERAGHPFQFRQLVDLMACGPWPLTKAATAALHASRHFGRYASDLELRNELGEIVAHNMRRVPDRQDLEAHSDVLARLIDLSGYNAEAVGVWLGPARTHDLPGECPRRKLLAVHVLARHGTPELIEAAQQAAAGDDALTAEFTRARAAAESGESRPADAPPLPQPVGDPAPPYADVDPDGEIYRAGRATAEPRTTT